MGEDRAASAEKRTGDVLPSRQRHSSVISSCSEDAESETSGYPPTPDEEREEELEYGPGIVNKLRTRFLTISLKQNRGASIRRSCSMENLLDQDRPSRSGLMFCQNRGGGKDLDEHKNSHVWGNLKRAKSMDTLLMDLQSESTLANLQPETNGVSKKEPKIVLRRDGGLLRTGQTICDEELPKPDTVKTYKRMFEPAESRRGSYSRRPPVLRASAKSGSLSVSKTNGVSSSAKVNGSVSKSKLSAKQPPPVKAQPESESVIKNSSVLNPSPVNGEDSKPVCNGGFVKAVPVKIVDKTLCNGKIEKTVVETDVKGLNVSKKELHNNQKNSIICNGNTTHKELIKSESNEAYVKPDVKKLVKQTNKVVNGSDSPVINIVNGITTKPKIPPNRPTFIKNVKPASKVAELNGTEKKVPLVPKLKPVSVQKKPADITKIEPKKVTESVPNESKLNGEVNKEITETKLPKGIPDGKKSVEENNRKNVVKEESIAKETIPLDKTDATPKKELQKEITNHVNGDIPDIEKATISHKSDPVEIKHETKTSKKSSDPITTSMVFDFRGKDVVPHVAVLPVPFGCKALHPKKKTVLIDGKEVPNGVASDDEDEYHMDYSVPPPCGVTFEGENVKIGKGAILSIRNKDLKIQFDDNVDDNTFVYPSESSLLEDGEQQQSPLSPTPPPTNEIVQNGQSPPSKLKANTAIGSSGAGGLSTYTPSVLRTMDNFEPGMFRPPPTPEEADKGSVVVQSGEEENTQRRGDGDESRDGGEMLKPADPGIISSWSLSAGTSDLLF